jgi:cadmium resistance protein CadD (predicted permease)
MSAWVPMFQTLVWAGIIVSVLVFLRGPLKAIVKAISERIANGSAVEASIAGAFSIKIHQLRAMPHVWILPMLSMARYPLRLHGPRKGANRGRAAESYILCM